MPLAEALHQAFFAAASDYAATLALGADPDAGAIEFGGHDLGEALALPGPTRRLQPDPGTLVLFPAYFYHRTIPFAGAGRRISIAFDVLLAP